MSPSGLRVLILLAVVGGVFALRSGLRAVKDFRPPSPFAPPARPTLPADVGLRLSGVTLVGRSAGKRAWTLTARQVEGTRSRDKWTLQGGVEATPLERDGKTPQSRIRAPRALYEVAAKRVAAEGGVEALAWERGQPRLELAAPKATYALKEKSLTAVGGTRTTLKEAGAVRGILTCPTLSYALEKKQVRASGGFLAELLPKKPTDKRATLSGPSALWDEPGQTLTCSEGATLTRGTLSGYSARLKADLKRGIYSSQEGFGSALIDEVEEITRSL